MRIKDLGNIATDFASDDYIVIDGATNGSRKMKNDSLLKVTAQNALAGNVAKAFDPTKPNDAGGYAYYRNDRVIYDGLYYKFKQNKTSGAWDSSKVDRIDLDDVFATKVDTDDFEEHCNENSLSFDILDREISENINVNVLLATLENYGISYNAPQVIQSWNGRTLKFFKVKQGEKFKVVATSDSYLRLGYTANYPKDGDSVTNFGTAVYYNVTLTAPSDGYFVISNIINNDTTFSVSVTEINEGLGTDVAKLKDDVQEIDNALFYDKKTDKAIDERFDDYSIKSSGVVTPYGSPNIYDVVGINVVAGETYIVKGTGQAGSSEKCYAVYNTSTLADLDAQHVLLISDENCGLGTYELEVKIPTGGVFLAATATYGTGISFIKKEKVAKTDDITNIQKTLFRYALKNNIIDVAAPCGDKEIVVRLGVQTIGNNLFDVICLAQIDKGDPISDLYFTKVSTNSSDWIGPFQVAAVSNKTGDDTGSGDGYDSDGFKITFTGGAHRYNNTTIGSTATARLSDLNFRINGESVTEGNGYASKVEISWTNNIQAYNTKKSDGTGREVLKEHCKLLYDGIEWKVEIVLEPLEEISIRTWYGLQMTGVSGNTSTHWKYVDAVNRGADATYSGNNSTKAAIAYGGNYHAEMWVDTIVDLGRRWLCYNNIINSAFHSGSKLYFMLANDYSEGNRLQYGSFYYLYGKYIISIP